MKNKTQIWSNHHLSIGKKSTVWMKNLESTDWTTTLDKQNPHISQEWQTAQDIPKCWET